jgi:hypothetical protein
MVYGVWVSAFLGREKRLNILVILGGSRGKGLKCG